MNRSRKNIGVFINGKMDRVFIELLYFMERKYIKIKSIRNSIKLSLNNETIFQNRYSKNALRTEF